MGTRTHDRRSLRLRHHDYARPGAYLVTICARDRRCVFGEVMDGAIRLNVSGRIVADSWEWLSRQYPYVITDISVIMPNHLHGIIMITEDCRGGSRTAPTRKQKPLGRLIGAFKTISTKHINQIRNTPGTRIWQRNYYEHVIRNEEELDKIREYILGDPAQWAFDRENLLAEKRQSEQENEIDNILGRAQHAPPLQM